LKFIQSWTRRVRKYPGTVGMASVRAVKLSSTEGHFEMGIYYWFSIGLDNRHYRKRNYYFGHIGVLSLFLPTQDVERVGEGRH